MNQQQKKLLLHIVALLCFVTVSAQFTITNPLKTKDATGLKIGDNASLTAATGADPNGNGWLRLTGSTGNQKGYMYVTQGFPTSLGLIADFEYLAWRNIPDLTYEGADGFSLFLFDASITDALFKLGGYGGSLGYATYNTPANTTGLSGGYLGIGFDEFGNYARGEEGRNGGAGDYFPNSIVLRGPTRPVYTNSNVYLTKHDLGDRTGGLAAIRLRNEIDYNTVTLLRPASNVFYRRVQISITKPGVDYVVNIKWRKENQSTFTNLMTYSLSSAANPIPANLKLGFAASTGGGYNFHEIRNILMTTPGNVRVDSRSDNAYVCNTKKNIITFKIEVTNDTAADLSNITFNTKFNNALNTILGTNIFKITALNVSGFSNSNLPTSNFTTNEINGAVGLLQNTSGIVTITGEYVLGIKTNSSFNAVSTIDPIQITDTDATNNMAKTLVDVRKCNVPTNPSIPSRYK